MLSKPEALKALRTFFKKKPLAMLPDIYTLLGTTSRMSAFRRLRELDYLSSFSHGGRYFTHCLPWPTLISRGCGFAKQSDFPVLVI